MSSERPRKPLRLRLLNVYPPFVGAGIRVRGIDLAAGTCRVRMKLRWWNKNLVGTHFGGSLYTMCDPFFMLLLLHQLGRDHIVWDKSAAIRFVRPGRGTVHARFEVPPERVAEIRRQAAEQAVVEPTFTTEVVDEAGEVVARVDKLLYVRRKERPG